MPAYLGWIQLWMFGIEQVLQPLQNNMTNYIQNNAKLGYHYLTREANLQLVYIWHIYWSLRCPWAMQMEQSVHY